MSGVEQKQQPETVTTQIVAVHGTYITGDGATNALVGLACKGIALLQNRPSFTIGQTVTVLKNQIVGNIGVEEVEAAYKDGVEQGRKDLQKELDAVDEELDQALVEALDGHYLDKALEVLEELDEDSDPILSTVPDVE